MLVWNSFHLTDSGERLLTPKHFDLAFIPSSLTPALQAPNKYLNMPFKTRDPAQYQDWMGNGPFMYLPSGKKWAPRTDLVLKWVNKLWQRILQSWSSNHSCPAVFKMHLMALRMMLFTKKRLKVEKVRMQMTN